MKKNGEKKASLPWQKIWKSTHTRTHTQSHYFQISVIKVKRHFNMLLGQRKHVRRLDSTRSTGQGFRDGRCGAAGGSNIKVVLECQAKKSGLFFFSFRKHGTLGKCRPTLLPSPAPQKEKSWEVTLLAIIFTTLSFPFFSLLKVLSKKSSLLITMTMNCESRSVGQERGEG